MCAVVISSFNSVLQIAFALNVFASYIQDIKKGGLREFADMISDVFREYTISQNHAMYSEKLSLETRALRIQRNLRLIADAMSCYTLSSSICALGILVYAGFLPNAKVYTLEMLLILVFLLLSPILTLCIVYLTLSVLRKKLANIVNEMVPRWEAAGFNKDKVVRISILAKQFSGVRVRLYESESLKAKMLRRLSHVWAKIRGHKIISLGAEDANRLFFLSQKLGKDSSETAASALSFLKLIADSPDSYIVIRNKDGKEVRRILNKDIIAFVRGGKNPFE